LIIHVDFFVVYRLLTRYCHLSGSVDIYFY